MSKDRKLVLIEGRWDVKSLKLNVGFQSKMYIRPIQKCLDTTELLQDGETSELKQSCMNCGEEFFVNELRTHVQTCNSDGEIDEESLVKTSNEQEDVSDGKTEFETIHVQTSDSEPVAAEPITLIAEMQTEISEHAISNATLGHLVQGERENREAVTTENVSVDESEQDGDRQSNNAEAYTVQLPFQNTTTDQTSDDTDSVITDCIQFCKINNITDPVDILKYIQKKILQGRKLEVEDDSEALEGETNFIIVDRNDVLRTGLQEMAAINNPRLTLEVEFYDEVCSQLLRLY